MSDDEDDQSTSRRKHSGDVLRRKKGYDSRIEQMICENLEVPIVITDAGKSHESGGSYIVYTIRTGACHYHG